MPVITVIDERGRDLIINNTISVPKDKVTIIKHGEFCELRFDKLYYSQVDKRLTLRCIGRAALILRQLPMMNYLKSYIS